MGPTRPKHYLRRHLRSRRHASLASQPKPRRFRRTDIRRTDKRDDNLLSASDQAEITRTDIRPSYFRCRVSDNPRLMWGYFSTFLLFVSEGARIASSRCRPGAPGPGTRDRGPGHYSHASLSSQTHEPPLPNPPVMCPDTDGMPRYVGRPVCMRRHCCYKARWCGEGSAVRVSANATSLCSSPGQRIPRHVSRV